MMSQGYPYDVTSEGIPHNNKLKYHQSSYMHAKSADSGTIWYMYEWPLHLLYF